MPLFRTHEDITEESRSLLDPSVNADWFERVAKLDHIDVVIDIVASSVTRMTSSSRQLSMNGTLTNSASFTSAGR
jgi:hypothetical protein